METQVDHMEAQETIPSEGYSREMGEDQDCGWPHAPK